MSKTFSIACKDCKKHLWIGQGWDESDFKIYFNEPKTMEKLKNFLWEHKGHNLFFDDNCESIILDYNEIEVD